jgi:hypothetical protein
MNLCQTPELILVLSVVSYIGCGFLGACFYDLIRNWRNK